ncbi:tRNA lysidine(34) synthetase TilS [Brevibacterium renqingii]|uniref:tRNA lysidine(34) synthetase TilS n=1 Tax=Brevibacterium renqingii TaxID=2776916 RepID=UPI001AE08F20|nr:tRNA lysidine(34) synthetase TilS [Brevibacterium renqingii]
MADRIPPRRPTLDPASGAVRNAVRACLAAAADLPSGPVSGAEGAVVPELIVAVSGGADSMSLLHACAFLHRRGDIRARAVTVDHGLQSETAEVAHRVAATAESWGMPAEVVGVDVSATDEGLEAAARNARYAALESARTNAGADWTLTAHTRSDQAETVLLGLMRGSGTRSLAGMSPRTGRLLRPLLGLDREQTEAACRAQGIEIWDDPMNADTAFARVRTRRLLAGLEAELGQPIAANLARTADLCRADADYLDARAAEAGAHLRGLASLPLESFTGLEDAVLGRVLRDWVISLGVPAQNLGAARVAELSALIRNGGRGRLSLPGDTELLVGQGSVVFQRAAKAR